MTTANSQVNLIDASDTAVGLASHIIGGKHYPSRTLASPSGELAEFGPYSYSRKTADGQVKGSAGFLHSVTISPRTASPTPGLVTIYDSTTEAGSVIYSEWIFANTPGHTVVFDVACLSGIFVGFDGSLDDVQITISFR